MKNLLLFLCFFLTGIIIQAQSSSRADSLQRLLDKEKTDTGRIVLSYRLAYELQYSDPEKSELITRQALEESLKLSFPKGTANSKIQLGNLELIKGNNETATQYYLDALDILTRADIKEGITVCYNNLGIIAHNTNDYSKANEYYRRSLSINRELGRKFGHMGHTTRHDISKFCFAADFNQQHTGLSRNRRNHTCK